MSLLKRGKWNDDNEQDNDWVVFGPWHFARFIIDAIFFFLSSYFCERKRRADGMCAWDVKTTRERVSPFRCPRAKCTHFYLKKTREHNARHVETHSRKTFALRHIFTDQFEQDIRWGQYERRRGAGKRRKSELVKFLFRNTTIEQNTSFFFLYPAGQYLLILNYFVDVICRGLVNWSLFLNSEYLRSIWKIF